MSRGRIWLCGAIGLFLTVVPGLLMEASPAGSGGASGDRVLSLLVGPGVLVSRALFGVHNLGFFVLAPLLNLLFWSGVTYGAAEFYAHFLRRAS